MEDREEEIYSDADKDDLLGDIPELATYDLLYNKARRFNGLLYVGNVKCLGCNFFIENCECILFTNGKYEYLNGWVLTKGHEGQPILTLTSDEKLTSITQWLKDSKDKIEEENYNKNTELEGCLNDYDWRSYYSLYKMANDYSPNSEPLMIVGSVFCTGCRCLLDRNCECTYSQKFAWVLSNLETYTIGDPVLCYEEVDVKFG